MFSRKPKKLAKIMVVTPEDDPTSSFISACLKDNQTDTMEIVENLVETKEGAFVLSGSEFGIDGKPKVCRSESIRRIDGIIASAENEINPEKRDLFFRMKDEWLRIRQTQRDSQIPVLIILIEKQDIESVSLPAQSWKRKLVITDSCTQVECVHSKDVQKLVSVFRATCTKRMERMDQQIKKKDKKILY